MTFAYTRIRKPEIYYHFAFWLLITAIVMINTAWTKILYLNGFFFVLLGLAAPIYVIALYLIPRFLNKRGLLEFALCLTALIVVVNVFKALLLASSLASIPEARFVFRHEFDKWLFRDFEHLDKFVFSGTAWIFYGAFTYRFVKDWIIYKTENRELAEENKVLHQALTRPSEIKDFLSTAAKFAERFSTKRRIVGGYFFVNTGTERCKICIKDIRYIEGNGNYVNYHLVDHKIMERSSLKEILTVLPEAEFVQVQRSYVVALAHIDKIRDNHVYVGDTKVSIGPNYKGGFKEIIDELSVR
jgi:hypothetical protein